jgi:AhpD family alkylhydroperoxidase
MKALDSAVAETGLEPSLRELIMFRASQNNGCGYCIDMHGKDARRPDRAGRPEDVDSEAGIGSRAHGARTHPT